MLRRAMPLLSDVLPFKKQCSVLSSALPASTASVHLGSKSETTPPETCASQHAPVRIVPREFLLSKEEFSLFDTLKRFVAVSTSKVGKTHLRAAGGWVRDKLLGRDCHDIDVALDNITGEDFAFQFNELSENGWRVKQGFSSHTVGVIQSNPAQSKHLATATMRIDGISLDFVNLRTEAYADNGRIPTEVSFGSPMEDALRRDFTINSLFYNIETDMIEDFTGRGLHDLECRRLATPIDPFITLKDDALRLLRGLRFAAVFNLSLDPEFLNAAHEAVVRQRLATMISRERIGQEIDKMLLSASPFLGFSLLCCKANIIDIVLAMPEDQTLDPSWWRAGLCLVKGVEALVSVSELSDDRKQHRPTELQIDASSDSIKFFVSSATLRLLSYAAFLYPFRNTAAELSETKTSTNKAALLPATLLGHSLKLKRRDITVVEKLQKAADLWVALFSMWQSKSSFPSALPHSVWSECVSIDSEFCHNWNVILGMTIRYIWEALWKESLILACAVEHSVDEGKWKLAAKEFLNIIQVLTEKHIFKHYPINGKELKKVLTRLPSGPTIQEVLNFEAQICLAHPQIDMDALQERLKSKYCSYL